MTCYIVHHYVGASKQVAAGTLTCTFTPALGQNVEVLSIRIFGPATNANENPIDITLASRQIITNYTIGALPDGQEYYYPCDDYIETFAHQKQTPINFAYPNALIIESTNNVADDEILYFQLVYKSNIYRECNHAWTVSAGTYNEGAPSVSIGAAID